MAANFVIQVLIVRELAKTEYGAFAYAMSIANLGQTIVTLGLDRATTRFIPIYDEREDHAKLFGTLTLVVSTIVVLGIAFVAVVAGLRGSLGGDQAHRDAAVLLVTLAFLAPIQALDDLQTGLFAVFASARSIFVRKYVLAPVLRLTVVILLVWQGAGATFLAAGYVLAGAIGIVIYAWLLLRALRDRGLLQHFKFREISIPFREVFAFTIPLMSSDLVYGVMNTSDAILLKRYTGEAAVAALRAVVPLAGFNQLVMSSFNTLFVPGASRMFARGDKQGLNDLYWQTGVWTAVLTFPIFAVTFSLAHPVTTLLFGSRYDSSGTFLMLLSLGMYVGAATGFNGLMVKVCGDVYYLVVINVLAGATNLVLNLVLIPRHGALGAAIGTCATLIVHNIFKQYGLRRTGVKMFDRRYSMVYASIGIAATGLLLLQVLVDPSVWVAVTAAAVASFAVLSLNRRELRVEDTFPELLKLPFARTIFGAKR
jgi:O-antigen/teichoic acid export membrane protein